MDRADRCQAIQTCIATRDCSRLRAIEAKDRERRDDAVSVNTTNTPTATASAELTRGGIIRVLSATYGLNCEDFEPLKKKNTVKLDNALADMSSQCNGKKTCQYTIYYKHIGDPAYGCEKDFRATYACTLNWEEHEIFVEKEAGWGPERKSQTKTVTLSCE